MIAFFTRMAIVIATATLLTIVVTRLVLDSSADSTSLELLRGHAQLHAETIAATPPAERRGKAEELSELLGYPVRLEEASGSPEARSEMRAGEIHVIARVPDNPGQIVLGPIPFGRVSSLTTVVGLTLVIAFIVALVVTLAASRRIRRLEEVAARMRTGDFTARADRDESNALDGLAASLNELADRVGELLTDQRDLLRTVAHEIRAPIARMRFRVDAIDRKAGDDARKDTAGLVGDLEGVDKLFEELLTYVAFDEFDQDRPEMQTTAIAVIEAVTRVADEVTATDESITVEITGDETAKVIANQKLFDRAITNLLLNAMAYGGPLIRIEVRAFAEDCAIDVQDSGPGIPELYRPKVIKPFVRLSKKKTKGTGLGLAIVSRIMALHGGALHIVDSPRGGASVQLVWNRA